MMFRIFTVRNNIKGKKFPLIIDRLSMKMLKVKKVRKLIKAAKGNNSMNTRILLEVSAKGMNNSNETVMNDIRRTKAGFTC